MYILYNRLILIGPKITLSFTIMSYGGRHKACITGLSVFTELKRMNLFESFGI